MKLVVVINLSKENAKNKLNCKFWIMHFFYLLQFLDHSCVGIFVSLVFVHV